MPTRNLTIVVIAALLAYMCYQKAEHNRYSATISEVMRIIDEQYVDEVEPRDLFERAMDGMVSGLDQYSQYFGPESFRAMEESLDQKFGGVGIVVEKTNENEPLLVLSTVVETPAYKAGMLAGDKVLEIDGVSTVGMTSGDAIKKMRGDPGSVVTLKVLHAGDQTPIEMRIVRAEIPVESVLGDTRRSDGSWDFHLAEDPRIAYLHVTTFGQQTSKEIKHTLSQGKFPAVILDLRGNAGGLLSAAVETCDLFLEKGRIVSTRGRGNRERDIYNAAPDTTIGPNVPMVVLVNRYSASASEIVAACLQDHQRAIVVGQRTWGKGTVQNLFELENRRSALKITTASYWRPSGQNIHRPKDANGKDASDTDDWGVRPSANFDVVIPDEQYAEILKSRQTRNRRQTLPHELPPTPATSSENTDAGTEQTPTRVEDPQLKRAVEYLKQQLVGPQVVAGKG